MGGLFAGRRLGEPGAVFFILVAFIPLSNSLIPPTRAATSAENSVAKTPKVLSLYYGTNRDHEFHKPFRSGSEWTLECMTLGTWVVAAFLVYRSRRRKRRVTTALAGLSLLSALFLSGTFVNALLDEMRQAADHQYGAELGPLSFGVCKVSIPAHHVSGQVETPSVFKWEFVANRLEDIVLEKTTPHDIDGFERSLAKTLSEASRKDIFLFVHGFNTSFADAADRTAQLAHDIEFQGVPAFYSWPSQAILTEYKTDERQVAQSLEPFRRYLRMLTVDAKPATIHILAHSMGNQLLTKALDGYDLKNGLGPGEELPRIRLILAAPDVDASQFCNEIADEIHNHADHVTLYTSPNDMALLASQMEHHGKPRLGIWHFNDYAEFVQSSPHLMEDAKRPFPEIESVVYVAEDTIPEELGHGYYAHHPNVVVDLSQLINEYRPASERTMPHAETLLNAGNARVWRLR
jgi:esterase/lipase superfamily enzyme